MPVISATLKLNGEQLFFSEADEMKGDNNDITVLKIAFPLIITTLKARERMV